MKVLTLDDLSEFQRVALGVIGAGLAPSSIAHDPGFRLDSLTAVSLALVRGLPESEYFDSSGAARLDFQKDLSNVYQELDEQHILGLGGPPVDVLLEPGRGSMPRREGEPIVNFDQYPTVLDRHLAGRCLDQLLKHPGVYKFIMGKYAESSEIWQRVYQEYV